MTTTTEQLPPATLASLLAADIECQIYEEHVYPALKRLRIDGMTPAGFPELKSLERYLKDTLDVGTASECVVARTALSDLRAAIAADRASRTAGGDAVFEVGFGWLKPATDYPRGTKLYLSPTAPDAIQAEQAAMYRHIRDHARITAEHWGGRWSLVMEGPAPDTREELDDAIRAAMAAAKGDAS